MSFLTIPFTRLKNNYSPPESTHYETTEMTQIVDLDSFMDLMDSRNSLSGILDDDNDDDDDSSLSSQSTRAESIMTDNHVKYSYNEEEDDTRFLGDEAEQSLVGTNDLENASPVKRKKVTFHRFSQTKHTKHYIYISERWKKMGLHVFSFVNLGILVDMDHWIESNGSR